jgi:histidinol-phosphatase
VTAADLALALELADIADRLTIDRFRSADLRVETKPDLTPVSDADRAVEAAVRARLTAARPADAVLGEEFGGTEEAAGRRWLIDPIDGTKSFVRGHPVWATLLALEIEGAVNVGVISAPALARRWWATRGDGAWTSSINGDVGVCRVSAVRELRDAFLAYSGLGGWGEREPGFRTLTKSVWRNRGYGDFWSYTMVAEGIVDIACEPDVSLWDLAPLQLLVEEAGGTFTDLTGHHRADGGSALATNGLLHEAALSLLNG